METETVIKIKFGNKVRRTSIDEDDFTFVMLKEKICKMFSLTVDAKFEITYIDEDEEVITLCDEDDVNQLTAQDLNPVRMTITMEDDDYDLTH